MELASVTSKIFWTEVAIIWWFSSGMCHLSLVHTVSVSPKQVMVAGLAHKKTQKHGSRTGIREKHSKGAPNKDTSQVLWLIEIQGLSRLNELIVFSKDIRVLLYVYASKHELTIYRQTVKKRIFCEFTSCLPSVVTVCREQSFWTRCYCCCGMNV